MNALVPLEPIPLPPAHRPAMMPSLPAWAASLSAAVRPELQLVTDPTGRDQFADVPVLPKGRMPTAAQREAMERHIDSLRSFLAQTPQRGQEWETRTATAITKLLLVLPGARKSDVGAEARNEVYLDVLDDVPCWAVENAIRRWHRHECGTDERGHARDYRWAPDPGTLRQIALQDARAMDNRIADLRKPLDAFEYVDCSAALERGRLAMRGLHKTMADKGDIGALTFAKAVEIGTAVEQPAPQGAAE